MEEKTIKHEISDFPMPDSKETERQVIADLVFDQSLMMEASERLSPEVFHDGKSRKAYMALKTMYDGHENIDLTTFSPKVCASYRDKILSLSGNAASSPLSFASHITALLETSARIKAYQMAVKVLQNSSTPGITPIDLLKEPEALIAEIRDGIERTSRVVCIGEALNDLGNKISDEQEQREKGRSNRVHTTIPGLEAITHGGFNSGDLLILAARPSVGKTAIALQFAMDAARAKTPTLFLSLEMTTSSLAQRIALADGLRPEMISNTMDWDCYEKIVKRNGKVPMYIDDTAKGIDEICSRIILAHQRGRCNFAVIDYLGLVREVAESDTKNNSIGRVTARLKQLAKDCDIPILLLCQLNRNSAVGNRPPELYDLRDSGSIEQDADFVAMLEKHMQGGCCTLSMWIRKNRQGKGGDIAIELRPNQTYTAFSQLYIKGIDYSNPKS